MSNLHQLLDSFALRAAYGSMHRFTFRTGRGFNGRTVEQILSERGIRIYERVKHAPGELGFSVRQEHAEWAEYLLCRAGVPLTSPILNPENAALLEGPEKRRKSFLETLLAILNWF